MAFYWTTDLDDHGRAIREDCSLNRAETEEAAMTAARAALARELDPEDVGKIEVGEITESDCWARVPADWSSSKICEYAAERGVDPADVSIARPGEHPGLQSNTWLSVRPGNGHVVAAWVGD